MEKIKQAPLHQEEALARPLLASMDTNYFFLSFILSFILSFFLFLFLFLFFLYFFFFATLKLTNHAAPTLLAFLDFVDSYPCQPDPDQQTEQLIVLVSLYWQPLPKSSVPQTPAPIHAVSPPALQGFSLSGSLPVESTPLL